VRQLPSGIAHRDLEALAKLGARGLDLTDLGTVVAGEAPAQRALLDSEHPHHLAGFAQAPTSRLAGALHRSMLRP
jgi:hypothetical protein